MSAPDCSACVSLAGRMTCARSVGSHWNPATNQRRRRVNVDIALERSTKREWTGRQRCGPEGLFFEPRVLCGDVAAALPGTIGDSDGDDGA